MLEAGDPLPLEQKHFDFEANPKVVEHTLEPTPIDPKGINCYSPTLLNSLPSIITKYCDEYIALLGGPVILKGQQQKEASTTLNINKKRLPCVSSDESIGSSNYPAFQNERWMDRFHELVDFHEKEGHFNVPYQRNTTLFQWVKRQRHQYKLRNLGGHSNLTEERISLLSKVCFIWNSHLAAWNDKFQELKEFQAVHGHCFVPCTYNGSAKLSTWIKRQRRQYRKFMANQPSTLDPQRIEKLEDLGLVWDYYGSKGQIPTIDFSAVGTWE